MWTDHTEYEECQKLQLSTVVRYQHNNTLGNVSSSKNPKEYRDVFFPISHTPTVHQTQEWHCCWIKMYIKTSTVDLSVDAKKLHLQKLWIALVKTGGIRNAWLKFKCCAWATERKHFSLFFTSHNKMLCELIWNILPVFFRYFIERYISANHFVPGGSTGNYIYF